MTQFNAPTYDIQRPTGQCTFTGRTLEPGEDYIATLVELDLNPPEAPPPPEVEAEAENAAGNSAGNSASDSSDASSRESSDTKAEPRQTADASALGMKRLDVSLEAWQEGHRPPNVFSFWKTTVPVREEKKKLFIDDTVLMQLFRRLAETDDEQRLAFRFVLGMILMRKRLLKYEASEKLTTDDGSPQEWWVLSVRGEEQRLRLLNPHLDETRIQQVSQQLSEILEAEL